MSERVKAGEIKGRGGTVGTRRGWVPSEENQSEHNGTLTMIPPGFTCVKLTYCSGQRLR